MRDSSNMRDVVKSSWNDQKALLKASFSKLSETDLHYENGKREDMLNKVQLKLGKTREELTAIISAL